MSGTQEVPETGELLAALLGRMHVLNRLASSRAPGGQSPTYYRTLGLLADGGPARIGDLADRVHVTQPGMTKIINQLELAGGVERTVDPEDSRAVLVSITVVGRDLIHARTTQIVEHLLPDFADLDLDERQALAQTVEILRRHMDGGPVAPDPAT